MSVEKEPMTQDAYNKLAEELKDLKQNQKPAILQAVEEARQLGDLKENAEYHSAKEKQAQIEIKIGEISNILSKATIVDPSKLAHNRVSFGSTVEIVDIDTEEEFTYTIVGGTESDTSKNLISFNSPLARAMLGREEGEEFEAKLPGGTKRFEIESIYYKPW